MFQIHITMTGKSYHPDDQYRIFAEETKSGFDSVKSAQEWLKEHYGKAKRVPMYRDKKDGATVRAGTIFCFNNADWSHSPVSKWRQQDWVEIREIKTVDGAA